MSAGIWTIAAYRPRLGCGFEITVTDPGGGDHVETIADFIGRIGDRAWAHDDTDLAHVEVLHAHYLARLEREAAAGAAQPTKGVFLVETTEGQEAIGMLTKGRVGWVFAETLTGTADRTPPED